MNLPKHDEFISKLAKSSTGRSLIKYLEDVEIYYADIRNLEDVPATSRIDALKIFRESLLDKLIKLSGHITPPDNDEYK